MMLYHLTDSIIFFAQNNGNGNGNGAVNTVIDTVCIAKHWELGLEAMKFTAINGVCLLITGLIYRI